MPPDVEGPYETTPDSGVPAESRSDSGGWSGLPAESGSDFVEWFPSGATTESLADSVAWSDELQTDATEPIPPVSVDPVIQLEGVGKTYRTGSVFVEALRDVTLSIASGEYVAIMGPSGSGKSTLMHILGCLDVPTTGRYLLAGDDVSRLSEFELAEIRNRRVGFVFQQFNLLAGMSAWRNVELPLSYAGVRRAERRTRAVDQLGRVGLDDRIDHRPGELSGGQQQRVAVARALVTDPALILADEPTGNLDSASTEDILNLLDALHGQGRTVVLITHEHDVAARAQRVIQLRDGLISSDSGGL